MQPRDACRDQVGKPSSIPPHGDLAVSGVSAFGPPGNMAKVRRNGTARSAATGCTKTRRRETHRTNGLLANDRQTSWKNDGHALCVAPAGDGQQTHDSGDTDSFADKDGAMSCMNSWAIECCDENLTETSAAVPHTWRWRATCRMSLELLMI